MLSLKPVVVLRDSFVLQLCRVFVKVQAFVLPPQTASAALESVHGEVARDVHAL